MPQLIKRPQNEGVGKQPKSGKVFLLMAVFTIKKKGIIPDSTHLCPIVFLWHKIMDRLRLKLLARTEKQCDI